MGMGMGMGMGTGMEMEMEGNGCLNFGIVVMGIFRTYLPWGTCILVVESEAGSRILYIFGGYYIEILVLGRMYVNWIYCRYTKGLPRSPLSSSTLMRITAMYL